MQLGYTLLRKKQQKTISERKRKTINKTKNSTVAALVKKFFKLTSAYRGKFNPTAEVEENDKLFDLK